MSWEEHTYSESSGRLISLVRVDLIGQKEKCGIGIDILGEVSRNFEAGLGSYNFGESIACRELVNVQLALTYKWVVLEPIP